MGYFEFLHALRIICLPLNISEKLQWQYVLEELEKVETHRLHLCWSDTTPTHLEEQHLPFKQTGTYIVFSTGYQSCNCPRSGLFYWKKPCSGCNSGIDLVVVLNKCSFKFDPIPRKPPRFARFWRSYVNGPAVFLTNYCQVTLSFCLMCAIQSGSSFLQLFVPNDSAFASLSTSVAQMVLTPKWIGRRTGVK